MAELQLQRATLRLRSTNTDMPSEHQEIQTKLNTLKRLFIRIVLQYQRMAKSKSRRELLYQQSLLSIGRDVSPFDVVDDDLGCAESLSNIIKKVVPFPIITGTWTLRAKLTTSRLFMEATENTGRGTIILCATGSGNGTIRGHVGILGDNGTIMSNSSATGQWTQNYTLEAWKERWEKAGGFTIHYYTLI